MEQNTAKAKPFLTDVEKYSQSDAINQSTLKKILIHPMEYLKYRLPEDEGGLSEDEKKKISEKNHNIVGSAVDYLLSNPNGQLDDVFYVQKEPIALSDTLKSIMNEVFENIKLTHPNTTDVDILNCKSMILDLCKEVNYGQAWKEETLWAKFLVPEVTEYLKECFEKNGKIVISYENKMKAMEVVESLKTNKVTKKYFDAYNNPNYDVFTQLPLYWQYKSDVYLFNCKSLIDLLIIDNERKSILICDFKTTSGYTSQFESSFFSYRYDFQAEFYTKALVWNLENNPDFSKFKEYTILPFRFIVESTEHVGSPMIFKYNSLNISEDFKLGDKLYERVGSAFNRLAYHKKNDSWQYKKEHTNGECLIK